MYSGDLSRVAGRWFAAVVMLPIILLTVSTAASAAFTPVVDTAFTESSKFYDRIHRVYYTLISARNLSATPLSGPLRIVVPSSTLPVLNADGITANGEPFFTISASSTFVLAPGESTAIVRIDFQRLRRLLSYELRLEQDVTNGAPVADAGAAQSVNLGQSVQLDGSGSFDVDGDALSFTWSLISIPAGSSAALSATTGVQPSFLVDRPGTYVIELIVNDGTVDSAPDTVTITTANTAPVAVAGPDQSALVGDTVQLDGSASSDVDGDGLSFAWSFISRPTGSTVSFSNPGAVMPSFVVDRPGSYLVRLSVDDGNVSSSPDTVTITTANSAPVAAAGPDQSAFVGNTVQLDGSGSSDVDGNVLSYAWSFVSRPSGSTVAFSSPSAVMPTIVVDRPGTYVAQLIVDDGTVGSTPDTVTITTANTAPVADAGADQTVFVGNTVQLDGNGSGDVDGDPLSFSWSLITAPTGSAALLANATSVSPTFTVDLFGTYVAQLIVNDSLLDSVPDTITITTANSAPVARAGPDQSVFVGDTVRLDASGSSDVDGDGLTFAWSLLAFPTGSTATLSAPTGESPTFVADRPGTYVAQLIVNDGALSSSPDSTVTITVNRPPVADAGPDQSVIVNTVVQLDGGASSDVDGDPLNFSWSLFAVPAGSSAVLSSNTAVNPTFIADRPGSYQAQLTVNDGIALSFPDTVTVESTQQPPSITDFAPKSAAVGTLVSITGNHFAPIFASAPRVAITMRGGGTMMAPVTHADNAGIAFAIPTGVTTGPITVTVDGQNTVSAQPLEIVPSSTYAITVQPAAADVIRGQSVAAYRISLGSDSGFTRLATLSVSGLPPGVNASFSPAVITTDQISMLTLTVPTGQPLSNTPLTITATAAIEGIEVVNSTTVTLNIVPETTSFLGRTVVADTLQTPLSGVTVSMLGRDNNGTPNGCTGTDVSDAAGNFALVNLPDACAGVQLVRYDGSTASAPPGNYAGVDLVYTLVTDQAIASPVLIHLPRIDKSETIQVTQNAAVDQTFSFQTIANLEVTVPAGTTFTLRGGAQPDPFPFTAVQVPVDRLPEEMPASATQVEPFIVAFQPANTVASLPVAVTFPNLSVSLPGEQVELSTLDPRLGTMVVYGTGTVSADGLRIIPDLDPAHPGLRFGLVFFDWHGPRGRNPNRPCQTLECEMAGAGPGGGDGGGDSGGGGGFGGGGGGGFGGGGNPAGPGGGPAGGDPPGGGNPPSGGPPGGDPPPAGGPSGGGGGPPAPDGGFGPMGGFGGSGGFGSGFGSSSGGNGGGGGGGGDGGGVDLFTGQFAFTHTDIRIRGRTPISTTRVYRSRFGNAGAFGVGSQINLQYCVARLSADALSLDDPHGRRIRFSRSTGQVFIPFGTTALEGATLTEQADGTFVLRFKFGGIYRFASTGCLVEMEGRNNDRITIARDTNGEISQIIDADGRSLTLSYTIVAGRRVISQIADPTGRHVSYRYTTFSGQPALTEVVDAQGDMTRYSYANLGGGTVVLNSVTDPSGATVLRNTYNNQGKVIRQTLADNSQVNISYQVSGGTVSEATVTDPEGNSFACRFNSQGVPVSRTDKRGQIQMMERETGTNRISAFSDALGRKTQMEYDSAGNVTRIIERDGSSTRYTYESTFNQISTITDNEGNVTRFSYDSNGNLNSARSPNPANALDVLSFNTFGQPQRIRDAEGRETVNTYDTQGNLTTITDALGNITTFTYDTLSRITSIRDPRGKKTTFEYDNRDRIVRSTNPLGRAVEFGYDPAGRLRTVTGETGNVTTYEYDARGRLTRVIDPLSAQTTYDYDAVGRLIRRVDRLGGETLYQRDPKGRLTLATYPDGESAAYSYDAMGRLIQAEDSASGEFEFDYDDMDRLTRESSPNGTVEYAYDTLGRRTTMTVVGSDSVIYGYSNEARLTSISRGADDVNFTYGATGLVQTIGRSNGVVTSFNHNTLRQLIDVTHSLGAATLARSGYSYDAAGNRTGMSTDHGLALGTPETTNSIGAGNRMLSAGATALSYDAAGRVTAMTGPGGLTTFGWDARGRLRSADGPAMTATFSYDPFGRRMSKTINGTRTDYLYDFANVVQESREGFPIADYLSALGLDTTFARTGDTGTQFLLKDGLGSVVAVTDEAGNVVTRYTYDPFGRTTVFGDPGNNMLQFTGREHDESGLYYYRARYYSPELARFLSEDPAGFFAGSSNLYTYAFNNPVLFTDPTGLYPLQFLFEKCFERPITPDEIKEYQSPEGRERRRRACYGVQATVMGLDLAQNAIPGGGGKPGKSIVGAAGGKASQLGALGVGATAGASGGDQAGSLSGSDF